MKHYIIRLILLLPVSLAAAALIYPLMHELSHALCAMAFGARVRECNILPTPNILCDASGLSEWQIFLTAVSGAVLPFLLCFFINVNGFWLQYISVLIIVISMLSFSLSICGFLFPIALLREQDDFVRAFSQISGGRAYGIAACCVGIGMGIFKLVHMIKRSKFIFDKT